MLKEIPAENVNIRPFRTHKTYMHSSGSYPIYTAHSASYDDEVIDFFDNLTTFEKVKMDTRMKYKRFMN